MLSRGPGAPREEYSLKSNTTVDTNGEAAVGCQPAAFSTGEWHGIS